MTDTVESVMALAEAIVMAELSGNMKEEARAALRAAVERVIAERNGARNGVAQAAMVNGLLNERAEKAEAERDALKGLLKEVGRFLDYLEAEGGHGIANHDRIRQLLARIDAALKTNGA